MSTDNVAPEGARSQQPISFPPGHAGDIAQFIYQAAPRPVREVAIVGTLGLLSGICGLSWKLPGSGLNTYIILIGRSVIGKEAMATGVATLIHAVAQKVLLAGEHVDFRDFVSGPALIKAVMENPCFVNVAGEFGHKFSAMANKPDTAMKSLRRAMTDLYGKSDAHSVAGGMAYSKKEDSVGSVDGAAFSLIGESTPGTFFDAITKDMMADGFMSRFTVVEYTGDRPEKNPNRLQAPWPGLVDGLVQLTTHALNLRQRNEYQNIGIEPAAFDLFNSFEQEADAKIKEAGDDESRRQMWNRAWLKAARIAGLLAVVDNSVAPVITTAHAEWSIGLIRRDIATFSKKLQAGEIGEGGDDAMQSALCSLIREYFSKPLHPRYARRFNKLKEDNFVPHDWLVKRTAPLKAFKTHKLGSNKALDSALDEMKKAGVLAETDSGKIWEKFEYRGKCYRVLELPSENGGPSHPLDLFIAKLDSMKQT